MLWGFSLLVGLAMAPAWGQPLTLDIRSRASSEIYEIKTQHEVPNSNGIFVIDPKTGEVIPVILAKMDGVNKAFKGFYHFEDSNGVYVSNHESLVWHDGSVSLINRNSRQKNTSSILTLGKSIPLSDIFTHRPMGTFSVEQPSDLKFITSGELFKVTEGKHRGEYRIALLSNAQITIGFAFEITRGNKPPRILNDKAFVLSRDPQSAEQLSALLGVPKRQAQGFVHAPVLQEGLLANLRSSSEAGSELVKFWALRLEDSLKYHRGEKKSASSPYVDIKSGERRGFPYFDLLQGRSVIEHLPVDFLDSRDAVVSTFDPISGKVILTRVTDSKPVDSFVDQTSIEKGRLPVGKLDRSPKGEAMVYPIQNLLLPKFAEFGLTTQNQGLPSSLSEGFLFSENGQWSLLLSKNERVLLDEIFRLDFGVDVPNEAGKTKAHLVRIKTSVTNHPTLQVFLISVYNSGKKRSVVSAFAVDEINGRYRIVSDLKKLKEENREITPAELVLRTSSFHSVPVFDNLTRVRSVSKYMDLVRNQTVYDDRGNVTLAPLKTAYAPLVNTDKILSPEERSKWHFSGEWVYFAPETRDPLGPDLEWRTYKPISKVLKHSDFDGLWMQLSKFDRSQAFVPTRLKDPVLDSTGKAIRLLARQKLVPVDVDETGKPIQLEVALLPTQASQKNQFVLNVLVRKERGLDVDVSYVQIPIPSPFESLVYVKILQGEKVSKDKVHLVMGFRSNSKTATVKEEIRVATFDLTGDKTFVKLDAQKLHGVYVEPRSFSEHLAIDPDGRYFWVKDPELPKSDSKNTVVDLLRPETKVDRGHVAHLREPPKQDENSVHFSTSSHQKGGRWEMRASRSLYDRVPGLDQVLDSVSEKDKNQKDAARRSLSTDEQRHRKLAFARFEKSLDGLLQRYQDMQGFEVFLVEDDLYPQFRKVQFEHLMEKNSGPTAMSRSYRGLRAVSEDVVLHFADQSLDSGEVAEEILHLAARSNEVGGKPNLLTFEPDLLLSYRPSLREDSEIYEHKSGDSSFLALLASGGKAVSLEDAVRERGRDEIRLPKGFLLASVSHWKEIEAKVSKLPGGMSLLRDFRLNTEHLTSDWTLWPPGFEKSKPEVNGVAKQVYYPEEMKVFPTLDRILSRAAKGQLSGKQKILIVPKEILPAIQRLILSRWIHSQDSESFSFENTNLALFQIGNKETQASLREHYRAVRGSALTRPTLVIGSLEGVLREGRPDNPKAPMTILKDPFTGGRDADLFSELFSGAHENVGEENQGDNELIAALKDRLDAIEMTIREGQEASMSGSREFVQPIHEIVALKTEYEEIRSRLESLSGGELPLDFSPREPKAVQLKPGHFLPHYIYWIAAEGKIVKPKHDRSWRLSEAVQPKAFTLLLGTEEELMALDAELQPEKNFFALKDHFDIVTLDRPDLRVKMDLVKSHMSRPNVQQLGLSYAIRGETVADQEGLIRYFINRVEAIANDMKMEPTTAFVKAYVALRTALVEDTELRRTRVFDEKFVERTFTRVFPLPLNIDILPSDDPLRKLSDVDRAVRDLQALRYEGPAELKRRIVEVALSQVQIKETGRPIPNSMIIFGGTSSGKTYLVDKFWELQGLIPYVPGRANNEDARSFKINGINITSEKSNDPQKYTADEVIEILLDLMSQPNGHRAHILLDDFHKIPKDAKIKMWQWFQGLFDAPGGMIRVRSKDTGAIKEIPVQNLNLYITLNPNKNEDQRRKYIVPNRTYPPDELLKREVLASISDSGFDPEESVLARVSDILNLDQFPRSARVPEIAARVREQNRTGSQIILVDPQVIDDIVDKSQGANARELLAPVTAALTRVPGHLEDGALYLVKPKSKERMSLDLRQIQASSSTALQEVVKGSTDFFSVRYQEPSTYFPFVEHMIREFRIQVLQNLSMTVVLEERMTLSLKNRAHSLSHFFLIGLLSHLQQIPEYGVGAINVNPLEFNVFGRDRAYALELFKERAKLDRGLVFNPAATLETEKIDLEDFIQGRHSIDQVHRGLADLIQSTQARLKGVHMKWLELFLRLNGTVSLQELHKWNTEMSSGWFESLSNEAPLEKAKELTSEMVDIFENLQRELAQRRFTDPREAEFVSHLDLYKTVRFFATLSDLALLDLPWLSSAHFLISNAQFAKDITFRSHPPFREYVGSQAFSFFSTSTLSSISSLVDVYLSKEHMTADDLSRHMQGFQKSCETILLGTKGDGL